MSETKSNLKFPYAIDDLIVAIFKSNGDLLDALKAIDKMEREYRAKGLPQVHTLEIAGECARAAISKAEGGASR